MNLKIITYLYFILLFSVLEICIAAKKIRVGPNEVHKTPSMAELFTVDGDTIEIQAGDYPGDVCAFSQNNLVIRGVGGYAHIQANGNHAGGKAIWVLKGNNNYIENIEFSGAKVPDRNGAGIRLEGTNLTLKSCYFHDNENGILAGDNENSEILIENCEFAYNGYGDGQTHNIYINRIKSFTLLFSYSHHAKIGHNVKSRASKNFILYSRIMDEEEGNSSYAIDLPNGGISYIIGNMIQQGLKTDNYHIISYGAEGLSHEINQLYIINNSMVNDRSSGVFLRIADGTTNVRILNNIFAGAGQVLNGPGNLVANLLTPDIHKTITIFSEKPGFVDIKNYDYRLLENSPAIDAGGNPGKVHDFDLTPHWEYVHPLKSRKRIIKGKIDIGAYEFNAE